MTRSLQQDTINTPTNLDKEFCNRDGEAVANPKADIRLKLEDFAPRAIVAESGNFDAEIFISAQTLCSYAVQVRKWVWMLHEGKGKGE